jgi:hypothetical protein
MKNVEAYWITFQLLSGIPMSALLHDGTSSHVRFSRPLLPRLRPCRYARRVSCAAVASRARCARRDSP